MSTTDAPSHHTANSVQPTLHIDGRRPRVLLGMSGSVAAIKLPQLVAALTAWADVRVVATKWALQFVSQETRDGLGCDVLGMCVVSVLCACCVL